MRNSILPLGLSSQKPVTPDQSWEEHKTSTNWETFYKIFDQYSASCQSHQIQGKSDNYQSQDKVKDTGPQNLMRDAGWDPGTKDSG